MERFKKVGKGGPVRLASTSGHVIIVDDEFVDIPDHMHRDAAAAGLMSESMYETAKQEVLNQQQGGGGGGGDKTNADPEAEAKKKQAIIAALTTITELVNGGESVSAGGNKLIHNGNPVLAAVSELAGFEVKRADIENALA